MAGTDPLSKLLMEAAFTAILKAIDAYRSHHQDNKKIVDACDNAEAMFNSAFNTLITQL